MNDNEEIVWTHYEGSGYKCLRAGFPDFTFYKIGCHGRITDVIFCEVKTAKAPLAPLQVEWLEFLKSLGFNTGEREIPHALAVGNSPDEEAKRLLKRV